MFKSRISDNLIMEYTLKNRPDAMEIGKNTLILAFKLSMKGPSCFYAERDLDFLPNGNYDIYKLISFISVGVGQGDSYNEGIYGPLPVLATNWRMLVFAKQVPDPEYVDVRMKGMNYVMLCFLYERRLDRHVAARRLEMEPRVVNFMDSVRKVQEIDQWRLREFKKELVDSIAF
ncbi:MAG: hypothetical protein ACXAEU_11315 [Candidatus Hodarchaeales archaeon]|jgi:hypothetical protein